MGKLTVTFLNTIILFECSLKRKDEINMIFKKGMNT